MNFGTAYTKTGKVKLGETVSYRSVSGIRHTSPKTHLKSLVVKLGDAKLQKEKSFMLKNLDLLASLIAEKNKSVAQFARTCRLGHPYKNVSFPIARPTHVFGKVKKKKN